MRTRNIVALFIGGIVALSVLCAGAVVGAIALTDRAINGVATQVANNPTPEPTATQTRLRLQAPTEVAQEPTALPTSAPTFTLMPTLTPEPVVTATPVVVVQQPTILPTATQLAPGITISGTTATFSISGAPASIQLQTPDSMFQGTLGFNTEHWIAEPGVWTGDPGDAQCRPDQSCWWISPDNQQKLMALDGMGIDLREDAWTLISARGGDYSILDTTINLGHDRLHNWFLLLKGRSPVEGEDMNAQIVARNYNAGFALETNLPAGARVSQGYMMQQVENTYTDDPCGWDCVSNSIAIYDTRNGAYVVIHQASRGAAWTLVATNIAGVNAQ